MSDTEEINAHELYGRIKSQPQGKWHSSQHLFVRAYEQGWYRENPQTSDEQKEIPKEDKREELIHDQAMNELRTYEQQYRQENPDWDRKQEEK